MRKIGKGGSTPFNIQTKPNLFSPLTSEEMLERRGESALWYRMSPCPCPTGEQIPDCKYCYEGQIRTFPEDILIQEEISYKVNGHDVFTRFGPIRSIEEALLISRGVKENLSVTKIYDDHFEVKELLKFWNQVELKYRVKLSEEIFVEGEGQNEFSVFPSLPMGGIVSVKEAYLISDSNSQIKIEPSGFTLSSVIFPIRVCGRYRLKLEYLSPIKIGYKTFTTDPNRQAFGKSQLTFEDGEVMAVVGSGFNIGQGDLFTLLVSKLRHSEYISYQPNSEIDTFAYSPVARIDSIISKEKSGLKHWRKSEDFILFGESKIKWLTDKPRGGYTAIYEYHPTFRVTGFVESGNGEDRDKPRIFKMKLVPSFNARE